MPEQIKLVKAFDAYMLEVKAAVGAAIKNSKLSRQQIADQMNGMILRGDGDGKITVAQINSWTKRDERRTSFVKYLPIFCCVVQDLSPLQVFLSANGLRITETRDLELMALGQSELARLEAIKRRKRALGRLGWRTEDEPEDDSDATK